MSAYYNEFDPFAAQWLRNLIEAGALGIGQSSGSGDAGGHWDAADWLYCRDNAWRPVEPGTYPLAHGVPNFMGRLRGYGNAIVPQVAAEVIRCVMDELF